MKVSWKRSSKGLERGEEKGRDEGVGRERAVEQERGIKVTLKSLDGMSR